MNLLLEKQNSLLKCPNHLLSSQGFLCSEREEVALPKNKKQGDKLDSISQKNLILHLRLCSCSESRRESSASNLRPSPARLPLLRVRSRKSGLVMRTQIALVGERPNRCRSEPPRSTGPGGTAPLQPGLICVHLNAPQDCRHLSSHDSFSSPEPQEVFGWPRGALSTQDLAPVCL